MNSERRFTLEQVEAAKHALNHSVSGILQAWQEGAPLLFLGIDPNSYYKTLFYKDGTVETRAFDLREAALTMHRWLTEGSLAIVIDPHLPPTDVVRCGFVQQKNSLGNVINHVPVGRVRPDYADHIPEGIPGHPRFAHQLLLGLYQFCMDSVLNKDQQPWGRTRPPHHGVVGIRKPD